MGHYVRDNSLPYSETMQVRHIEVLAEVTALIPKTPALMESTLVVSPSVESPGTSGRTAVTTSSVFPPP